MSKTVCVCLSSTIQKTILFERLEKDAVNRSIGYRLDASGKAVNAARVMCQLESGSAVAIAPLGVDNAETFLELASAEFLPVRWIPVPGRTRYCYTLLERGTGSTTELVVSEPSTDADYGELSDELTALARVELASADALLLAGSRPSFWPSDLPLRIVREAHAKGLPVMADFHGRDLELVMKESIPEIVKINEEEFCSTFSVPFPIEDERLAREIAAKSKQLGIVIAVTRGSRETIAADSGELFREGTDLVRAVNTIGCGDSFAAGFLHAWLASGRDMKAALACGRRCATANALSLRPGSIVDPSVEGEGLL
jgi:fructose-1-phosphate kinase PfkB-like protein